MPPDKRSPNDPFEWLNRAKSNLERAIAIAEAVVKWADEIVKRSYSPEDTEAEQ